MEPTKLAYVRMDSFLALLTSFTYINDLLENKLTY